ncbi:M48 family metalloprotease [Schlesneria paludicola]|uniref:M48 family metalloprotease n=1 Tax=Schlesneria paludicola TaxID=360056 RepID=UPI000299DF03|nr:M48 family metalloprotease [Schlesneria paludicola]
MLVDDTIPVQSELIERVRRANRLAIPWVLIQFVLAIALATFVNWPQILEEPLIAVVAVLVIVGPFLMSILRRYALNKREIGDLKEHTTFGEFDKYRLRFLVNDTLNRLNLPLPGPPVYITSDKSLNASSVHLGVGGAFRSLNGVYLNRQLLHHLTSAEVQDIIGHELGHFYRYYLLSERFHGITLALGALSGLVVTQVLGMSSLISMFALSVCGSVYWMVSGYLIARNAMAIEYLCDGFGAQVHGIAVSINGLLKLGVEDEMQLAIQYQQLATRGKKNLNALDVIEAIDAAIPYGHRSREEIERSVTEAIKQRSQHRNKPSLAGFFEYAWKSDDDEDEVEDLLKKIQRAQNVPRLDWERLLKRPDRIDLSEQEIPPLVEMIVTHPDEVLFRTPGELGDTDGVHPPIAARILYLWKNRAEIEAARKGIATESTRRSRVDRGLTR